MGGVGGRESPRVDNKILNVNTIDFKKKISQKGGGADNMDKVLFLNVGTFCCFLELFQYMLSSI